MIRRVLTLQARILFLGLSAPCVLSGCGAADTPPELPGVVSPDDDVEIGKVSSALDMTKTCDLIKSVSSFLFNGTPFSLDVLECSTDHVKNTYFNGSEGLAGNLSDLDILPFVQQGAYLCGIADADGAHVNAIRPGFGGFGVQSDFTTVLRDPANAQVNGRRTGSLVLFGLPAKFEAQDIKWGSPVEKTSNGSTYGDYLVVEGDGMVWEFAGTVTFPIGNVVVTLKPSVKTRSPTATMSNGGLKFTHDLPSFAIPIPEPNQLDSGFFFSNFVNCGSPPTCPLSRVASSTFMQEHTAACPADITSLTDHVLPYVGPYGGAGCSTQNFIFFNTLDNWFHFGRTGGKVVTSTRGPGEQDNVITSTAELTLSDIGNLEKNATMWTSLDLAFNYSLGFANITLDTITSLATRDGFAVRQVNPPHLDGTSVRDVNFTTALNAQAKAGMHVTLSASFVGLVPPFDFSFDIDLGDTGNQEALGANNVPGPATKIHYLDPDHTTFDRYEVKGVAKTNPDQARLQCSLATTVTKKSAPDMSQPGPYFKNVATEALKQIHPCHVKTCHKDGSSPVNFDWDPTLQNLVQSVPDRCHICTTVQMDVCDGSGRAVNTTTIQKGDLVSPTPPECVR